MINFNLARVKTDISEFEGNADTTMHEIIHILGFSRSLFKYFIDENGNVRGESNVV